MKLLLIGFFGKTYMPYIEHYQKVLDNASAEYDVCFFERYESRSIQIDCCDHGNEYTFFGETNANSLSKIKPVLKYARFVRKLIRDNRYDKLIVFTTMPAILLSDLLLGKYAGKYIFDYRDYTYERIPSFAKRVSKIVDASAFTTFSSRGYLENLEVRGKYLLTHNITNLGSVIDHADDLRTKGILHIGFIGYVRYFDLNARLISSFSNNPKFYLDYYGNRFSDCNLEAFCETNSIENVRFHGPFQNCDKPLLYKTVDLVNSIYSLDSPEVKQAIPNRLYDAVLFKKPIIVSKGTQLSQIVEDYNLGLAIDPMHDDVCNAVEEYIRTFVPERFESDCRRFLRDAEKDLQHHMECVKAFIESST